ncbi:MAG: heavy metal translocating P-type ATPase [Oscillatoria sp. PMC 1051.18]|nr:heavy metal translocating P-type ATPase [Oscillatoria sp. PMC 1050.18]MEC5029396.1 heavy metal translocating P-type ATPase [Oscillatoria sp. PMC 1051.18]
MAQSHSHHHNEPGAHRAGGHGKHAGHDPEMFKRRFFVCLVLTFPILYYSEQMQEWFGYTALLFPGWEWVNPILAIVVFFYGGWVFLKGAWHEFQGKIGMMTLIALAITVAFVYSLAVSFGLAGIPFYWELATLIDVMLLGHWIEMRSVETASRALEELTKLVPHQAHRYRDRNLEGQIEDVSVKEIVRGDLILIRPGEQISNDGEIVEGNTAVNESFLTGESRPVEKQKGDEVVAGSVNGEGAIKVEVTRVGEATTISQMKRLVEEAQKSRSGYQVLADRIAFWLTLVAIAVGTLTFVVWLVFEDLLFAINRTVTVLVITCPHALGLAIPLVIVSATALAAKNGILIRNREAVERARNIKTMAFDKTGTLTEGKFGVQRIYSEGLEEMEALAIAAALETSSEHPLAKAIATEAHKRNLEIPSMADFETVTGRGVGGKVNGQIYRIGRPEWVQEQNLTVTSSVKDGLAVADERGESAVVLMNRTSAVAVISLADRVRERARQTIDRLKELDIEPIMITGDAEAVARTVAQDLGIERYYARVLPEDKVNIIKKLKKEGATAFVGDGINDAAALLEANMGIAIGAGTNVAIESADLVLIEDDPLDAVKALNLGKKTYRKMIQNLFWATGYNVLAIPLAAGVAYSWGLLLSPAIGALLMSLSTVIVAINAVLLRRAKLA